MVVVDDGSTDDDRRRRRALRRARRPLRSPAARRRRPGAQHRPRGHLRSAGRLPRRRRRLAAATGSRPAWRTSSATPSSRSWPRTPSPATRAAARPPSCPPRARGRPRCSTQLLIDNVVLNPSSVLIRRSALEAAGGFSEIPFGEDWDTWLEIAKRFPIGFIDASARAGPAPHGQHLARRRVQRSTSTARSSTAICRPVQPAWKRPLIRRARRLGGALSRRAGQRDPAVTGAGRTAPRDRRRSRSTRSRSRAARSRCSTRVFVSEALVRRLSRALRDDVRLARELTGKRS